MRRGVSDGATSQYEGSLHMPLPRGEMSGGMGMKEPYHAFRFRTRRGADGKRVSLQSGPACPLAVISSVRVRRVQRDLQKKSDER